MYRHTRGETVGCRRLEDLEISNALVRVVAAHWRSSGRLHYVGARSSRTPQFSTRGILIQQRRYKT